MAEAVDAPHPPRLEPNAVAPGAIQAMGALETYLASTSLGAGLAELIKLRCSQINGCGFCVDLHARRLTRAGEAAQRLHAVAVWRESPLFTPRERAALAWAEAVTRLDGGDVPEPVYEQASRHFQPRELVDLTLAVTTINAWNRLSISFRRMPDTSAW